MRDIIRIDGGGTRMIHIRTLRTAIGMFDILVFRMQRTGSVGCPFLRHQGGRESMWPFVHRQHASCEGSAQPSYYYITNHINTYIPNVYGVVYRVVASMAT